MSKTISEIEDDLKRIKLDLANSRKTLVSISRQARKLKMMVGDRKKLAEVKSAIDSVYKNIK